MEELVISQELIGQRVRNAGRPEWGEGTVQRVQSAIVDGRAVHRVFIQFAVGQRILISPPARLTLPTPEPQRRAGWLDGLGKTSLDDRLRDLPESVTQVLGTPRERFTAVLPLYGISEESESMLSWARKQTGVSDPLSHWTRDELAVALRHFCNERDAYFRNLAAIIKQKEGLDGLRACIEEIPAEFREAAKAALQRPI